MISKFPESLVSGDNPAVYSDYDARQSAIAVLRALADEHRGNLGHYKMISGKRFVEWENKLEAKTDE
jgi:hypothetical protein